MNKRDEKYDFSASRSYSLTAGITYEDPRFHLNLVQKKDAPSERPFIHSTKAERLSYYRAFSASAVKTGIIISEHIRLNSFLWFYACNVFFKTLPHSFVHYFLSVYAPEEHFFITKMVPFSHGLKYLYVLTGFIEIVSNMDWLMILAHYSVMGIIHKNPWNRCINTTYYDSAINLTVRCYTVPEFAEKFFNQTYKALDYTYVDDDGEFFQISQIEYYRMNMFKIARRSHIIIFAIMWGILQFLVRYATKSIFWKVQHKIQITICVIDVICFINIASAYYKRGGQSNIVPLPVSKQLTEKPMWQTDLEVLSESITAPPIVHVLTSRSTQEIDPTTDSSNMVVSNAILYIFRGILTHNVQVHCEEMVHARIPITSFNQHSWIFFWPMFYTSFYLGDIFSTIYLLINLSTEFLVLVVTYLCLLESMIYEWPKLKRWMINLGLSVAACLFHHFTIANSRIVLWAYGKSLSTLAETVFLYLFYPIGRLIDDFTFHYGIAPTRLRILSLQLVAFYYIFKIYVLFQTIWDVLVSSGVAKYVTHYRWSWAIMVSPVFLGSLFIVYRYLIVYRMTWTYIFRPLPKWGPRDFSVRQLRKQFDSRFYIGSEVPRLLSRYLMSKRESKVYKVDVRYDFARRSTTLAASMAVRFGDQKEKKEE